MKTPKKVKIQLLYYLLYTPRFVIYSEIKAIFSEKKAATAEGPSLSSPQRKQQPSHLLVRLTQMANIYHI